MIYSLSWIVLMLIFLSRHSALLGSYGPFAMIFSLESLGIQWYILSATLLLGFGYFAQTFIDIRKIKPVSVAIERIKGDTAEPTENIEKATTEKDVE